MSNCFAPIISQRFNFTTIVAYSGNSLLALLSLLIALSACSFSEPEASFNDGFIADHNFTVTLNSTADGLNISYDAQSNATYKLIRSSSKNCSSASSADDCADHLEFAIDENSKYADSLPERTYYYKLAVSMSSIQEDLSAQYPPLDPPSSITASVRDKQIALSWRAVPEATGYNLYGARISGVTQDNYSILEGGFVEQNISNPYTLTNLTNGVSYYLVLTALNADGIESTYSEEINATPRNPDSNASELAAYYDLTADEVLINYTVGTNIPDGASLVLYRADEPIGTAACSVLDGISGCASGTSWADGSIPSSDSIDWSARRYYQLDISVDDTVIDRVFADISVSESLTMAQPVVTTGGDKFNLSWQTLPNVASYSLYIATDANATSATEANWSSLEGSSVVSNLTENSHLLDPDSDTTFYLALRATNSSNISTDLAPLYQLDGISYRIGSEWVQASIDAGWSGRYNHTSVAFDDKIWALGGYDGSREDDAWYSDDGITWLQRTAGAGWSGRYDHTSIVFDDKIWVLGGYDGSREDDVWYSDNGTDWTLATATAGWTSREGHASVVFDDKLWVIGGYAGSNENDIWYSDDGIDWVKATDSAEWSKRVRHTSVVFDEKIWVLGGYDDSYQNDVWYSINGATWTQATANAGWSARADHASVVFDEKIWVLGGYDGSNLNDVWYSDNGATWTQANTDTAWSARNGHTSAVFDGKLWVLGGFGGDYLNDVWYYSSASIDNFTFNALEYDYSPPQNQAPTFTSTAATTIFENNLLAYSATGEDPDGGTLAFAISGGADAALFTIESDSGELSFVTAPDHENPADSNTDNIYAVDLSIDDGSSSGEDLSLEITVTDDGGIPATPTGVQATPGDSFISLSWQSVADANSYRVYRDTDSGVSSRQYTLRTEVSSNSVTITAVNGTTYYHVVTAVNSVGESSESSVVSAQPQSSGILPADFSAVAGAAEVTLSWTSFSDDTTYNIYRSSDSDCDLDNYNTACSASEGELFTDKEPGFVDTGLTTFTTYYYWIEAILNGVTQRATDPISATPDKETIPLNDTGIDWGGDYDSGNNSDCSSNMSAPQDCHQGRDASSSTNDDSDGHAGFSFTKLDSSGNALAASASEWYCVLDNVTGLIWEVKTDDGGLRDKDDSYNWYNTDPATNGGSVGYADDDGDICYSYDSAYGSTYCNTEAFTARVNAVGLCGAKDWRMPSRQELHSIVDYSRYSPSIDQNFFPNTRSGSYWSASPLAENSDGAWLLQFYSGVDNGGYHNNNYHVRLVRSSQ